MKQFHDNIISWYEKHKRDLPWRHTKDPYKIWVSEIILQQTRVDQGLAYYKAFIDAFPDILALAAASEQDVLRLWQGLGYYSRARNMHYAANQIVTDYNGRFPDTYNNMIRLKGIGDYTASAILSISCGKAYPVVDGNVIRVLTRLFGITTASDTAQGRKEIHELAGRLIRSGDPGTYNQAVMEFGALCCTPQNPRCSTCIFKKQCKALESGPGNFPVKSTKSRVSERHYLYFVITSGSGKQQTVCLHKRTGAGIWKNMYDFPCIESDSPADIKQLRKKAEWKRLFGSVSADAGKVSHEFIHKLSHITMHVRFLPVMVAAKIHGNDHIWIRLSETGNYPVPRLIEKYLKENL